MAQIRELYGFRDDCEKCTAVAICSASATTTTTTTATFGLHVIILLMN